MSAGLRIAGLWGPVGVLRKESVYLLWQQTAWQRDESKVKPEQPLVLGLKSSLEERRQQGAGR